MWRDKAFEMGVTVSSVQVVLVGVDDENSRGDLSGGFVLCNAVTAVVW